MLKPLRLVGAAVAVAALAGGSAASAGAADGPATFGQDVAMCAQSLGQRTSPPEDHLQPGWDDDDLRQLRRRWSLHMNAHHG